MSMALGNFLNYDTPYDKSRLSMSHSEVCTSAEQKTSNDIFGLAKKGFASITLLTISLFLAPRRRAIAVGNYHLVRTELANVFSYKLLVNFFFYREPVGVPKEAEHKAWSLYFSNARGSA